MTEAENWIPVFANDDGGTKGQKEMSPRGFDMTRRIAFSWKQLFYRPVYSWKCIFYASVEFFREMSYINSACGGWSIVLKPAGDEIPRV